MDSTSISSNPSNVRILLLVDQLWCAIAGTEQHISFLMNRLPAAQCSTRLLLLRDTGYYDEKLYPQPKDSLNLGSFYNPVSTCRAISRVIRRVKKDRTQILYTFFPDSELVAAIASRFVRQVKVIAGRRDMGHLHTGRSIFRVKAVAPFISNYVANCNAVAERISELEGTDPRKFRVIHNPINRERVEWGLQQALSPGEFGISDDRPVVGIVATVSPVKDHETFLRAASLVLQVHPRAAFMIVGRMVPARRAEITKVVSELGIADSVFYAGEIDNPVGVMRLFDVAVLASRSEGLSNSLIEYAAAGLPIVATAVGGNGEIVADGVNGYLVPPQSPEALSDRIVSLLGDADTRQRFGEASKVIVEQKFSQEQILAAYRRFFEKILRHSSEPI